MKQIGLKAMLAATVIACGVSGSVGWSHDNGLSLSIEGAQARVGRPLTPVSVLHVEPPGERSLAGRPQAQQWWRRLAFACW